MKSFTIKKLTCLFTISLLFLSSCGTPYEPEQDQDSEEGLEEQIPETNEVQADATLEAVTWNIEWYGSEFSGPSDFELQTRNIVRVIDSLDADLYAFQEVHSQEDLNNITSKMKGYRGFIAEHVGQSQKMGFAFNTKSIDSLDAGAIRETDVRNAYQSGWKYNWAGGRTPLYFSFNYTFEGITEEFYAVVIHGKANTGDNDQEYQQAYERRKNAAEGLYHYLTENHPDANVILLGDYNDDVDQSIYYNSSGEHEETPYYQFVNDDTNFDVVSKRLSESGQSASVNYEDLIDHITISNELFDNLVQNSTSVYDAPLSYIENYGETTSDHLPVWIKLDITASNPAKLAP